MTDELKQRKEQVFNFLKKQQNKIIYLLLIFVIWLGAFIRTRNLPLLQKKYVLALDPHIVLRYVNYIVEHGKLFAVDTLRYYPFGFDTTKDLGFLSNIIAKMYGFFHVFKPSLTSTEFVIIYPIIMFIVSMVLFFLLVKLLFNNKYIALFATAFLAVMPSFLYRTMAGFSEKEPIGIFLMILTFLFFISANKSKNIKSFVIFGVLSGILTGILGIIWGGVQFVIIIIPLYYLILLIIKGYNKKEFQIYLSWLAPLLIIAYLKGLNILNILQSTSTIMYFFVAFLALANLIVLKYDLKERLKINLPIQILSFIIIILFGAIISSIFFGPQFLLQKLSTIKFQLLNPIGTGVFEVTVAEAHKPYFTDWWNQFQYFFYLFFIGAVCLFYNLIKKLKYAYHITTIYALFLLGFIFSRYSPTSKLNGDNSLSIFIYIMSLVIFVASILIFYLYFYYKDKENFKRLSKLNKYIIFTLVWFIIMVIGARGVIRLIFVFAPITAVIAGHLTGMIYKKITGTKTNYKKIIFLAIFLFILLAPINGSFASFTKTSYNTAKYTGPSFNNQWIEATEWIKQNTSEDSVFAHWWDYGYWVQTGANRATLSDGGNAQPNINHYVGRHVLTAQSPEEALTFLKTYQADYLLIISDEIGKYGAYSSIGSDKNRDRYSYIPVFFSNENDMQETRDRKIYLYKGTFVFDKDMDYNGILLTKYNSAVIGIMLPLSTQNNSIILQQPTAVVYNNGQQLKIPLECVFFNGQELNFQNKGLKGCLRIMPRVKSGNQIDYLGSALYVSEKVRPTLFAQMFLFEKQWPGFEKVYDDTEKGYQLAHYDPYGRMIGPLRIWKINPPANIPTDKYYLNVSATPRDLL